MSTSRFRRRQILQYAGVFGAGAAVATPAAASSATALGRDRRPSADGGVVGAWRVDRVDPGIGVKAQGIFTFASGGVLHYQDIFVLNALLHGAWSANGSNGARYEIWGGLPANTSTGAPASTARVAGTVTVARTSISGPYVVTLFEPASGNEVFRYEGSLTGTRLEP